MNENAPGAADELFLDTRFYGIGKEARIAAMRESDELRSRGIAAAPLFKPALGGWIVRIYPGGIRRREEWAER